VKGTIDHVEKAAVVSDKAPKPDASARVRLILDELAALVTVMDRNRCQRRSARKRAYRV
jgi:hypothetical protein